jgi:FKBP-type peptidyl-prolyl cis-trans isomerase
MSMMNDLVRGTLFTCVVVGLAACGSSTDVQVETEVIEETTFAASLGVELSEMQRTGTGVYYKDLVEGTGTAAVFGTTPTVTFTGWLTNGTEFDTGTFSFLMGNHRVILGFEDGLLGTKVGGTRLMVIPPNRGYGGQPQYDELGNEIIPPGSVLVFEVTLDTVAGG